MSDADPYFEEDPILEPYTNKCRIQIRYKHKPGSLTLLMVEFKSVKASTAGLKNQLEIILKNITLILEDNMNSYEDA